MRSSIAIEQREKEGKTLRSFLTYSLIGSLALHIGVLSLTANDLWNRKEEIAEEPIEIAIIDPPKLPTPEPEQKPEPPAKNVITKTPVAPPEPEPVAPQAATVVAPKVVRQQPPAPVAVQKPVANIKPAPQPKPVQKLEVATKPNPVPVQKVTPVATQAPVAINRQDVATNPQLAQQLRSLRDSRTSQTVATSTSVATQPKTTSDVGQRLNQITTPARTSTTNTGISNTRSSTTSTATSNTPRSYSTTPASRAGGTNTVATRSGVVKPRTNPSTSSSGGNENASNSSTGRFGCRNCTKPKYPEKARRRGIEGRAEISVDVDGKGNVTKVRIARSTGNRDLDEAAVREARRWKFDAPKGGRQGVVAKVDFAIEGSKRSRELRKQRQQRQASRKKRLATANNTPPATQGSTETRRVRRIQQSPAPQAARIRTNNTATVPRRRVETLPPRRAQDVQVRQRRTVQATPRQTQLQRSLRRQKPQSQPAASSSQSSLRNTLRRSRQQTHSGSVE